MNTLTNAKKAYGNLQFFLIQKFSYHTYAFNAYSQYSIAQTQYWCFSCTLFFSYGKLITPGIQIWSVSDQYAMTTMDIHERYLNNKFS